MNLLVYCMYLSLWVALQIARNQCPSSKSGPGHGAAPRKAALSATQTTTTDFKCARQSFLLRVDCSPFMIGLPALRSRDYFPFSTYDSYWSTIKSASRYWGRTLPGELGCAKLGSTGVNIGRALKWGMAMATAKKNCAFHTMPTYNTKKGI